MDGTEQKKPKHGRYHHPALEAMINISTAAEFVRQELDKVCRTEGITGVQYNVLRILKRAHPDGCTRTQVLEQLIEKSIDVTRTIDGLERKGLVERHRTNMDRRLSISAITAEGTALLEKLDPEFFRLLEVIAKKMPEEQWLLLSELCEKMYAPSA